LSETRPNYGPGEGQWQWMGVPVRCDTCRWWNTDPHIWGLRTLAAEASEWRPCILSNGMAGAPWHAESRMFARDQSDDGADLWTAPDFGCVQWGRKE
jgi:hypothetical protein